MRISSTTGLAHDPVRSPVARTAVELDPQENGSAGAEPPAARLVGGYLSRRDLARASGLRVLGSLRF